MPTSAKQLKALAAELVLKAGGNHEPVRKLIVGGFFDMARTTDELLTEIRQTTGARWESNVVQTYMRKFMEKGIIRSLTSNRRRGNLWVLASDDEVKAAQVALQTDKREADCTQPSAEAFALPSHPLLETPATRILFLAANPTDATRLALDRECREIEEKIRASDHRDEIEIVAKWAVRTKDLLQYLHQYRAHVIHFSGHGSDAEELILLGADEQAKPVSKAAIRKLFGTLKDNIQVVVLNACFSRPQAEAIVEVIDCAIGMKSSIGDEAAITFAAHFYQAIGFGRSVKQAFDSGITALMLENIPEEKTPELLVRKGVDPDAIFLIEAAKRAK